MKYRVHVQTAAVADIEEISASMHLLSPAAADRWLGLLEELIDSLEAFPKRFPMAPEVAHETHEIRQTVVGVYGVLFAIHNNDVYVLRLRHTARRNFKPGELN